MKDYDDGEKSPRMKLTVMALFIATILVVVVIAVPFAITYILGMSSPVNVDVSGSTVTVPVTLTANATTVTELDAVLLTATTGTNGNGLTVKFYDGSSMIGSQVIASGQAQMVVSGLAVGTHTFTAGP